MPAYRTQLADDRFTEVSAKRVFDAYALWTFSPETALRLLANNLAPGDYTSSTGADSRRRARTRGEHQPHAAEPATAAGTEAVTRQALTPQAFVILLVLACMFGANHVAARVALDHGLDVATAVAVRSLVTSAVVGVLAWQAGVLAPSLARIDARQWRAMLGISALVAVQSLCLYSSVARIPVGLSLLAFNTYPLWTAFAVWVLYRQAPERAVLVAMPVILLGLALALDVSGAAAGLSMADQWGRIGAGVGFAMAAAASFGLVLALTQHEVAALDGRFRTTLTMGLVGLLALAGTQAQGGMHWPTASAGWWGLAALTVVYGTAFTVTFILLPRLGVVGNSPILNVEPVAALLLAWALLGQRIAPVQVTGALLVVGTVMGLALRRR